jgi:hypothetical protein
MSQPHLSLTGVLLLVVAAGCAGGSSGSPESPARPGETRVRISSDVGPGTNLALRNDQADVAARIPHAPDVVWPLLPGAYGELGLEPDLMDIPARRLGVQRFTGSRLAGEPTLPYLRCGALGSGPSAVSQMRVVLSITTQVEEDGQGGSLLRTELSGSATPVAGGSRATTGCVTSGRLELRIAQLLRDRLPTP